jgi:hypothetical protein
MTVIVAYDNFEQTKGFCHFAIAFLVCCRGDSPSMVATAVSEDCRFYSKKVRIL